MPQLLTAPDRMPAAADRRPAGGGSRRGWWHAVGLVLAVLATVVVLGVSNEAAAVPAEASASMFDDDSGLALFRGAGRITPSTPQVACLLVGARGAASTDGVALAADAVTGPLADDLLVSVEVGTGGSAGDCSGFTGRQVWQGTLPELANPTPATGYWMGWRPASVPTATFRITVALDPDSTAAGQRAGADVVWRLLYQPGAGPEPTPTPSPADPTTADPTTAEPTTVDPTTADPTDSPTAVPSSPTGTAAGGRPDQDHREPDLDLAPRGPAGVLRQVVDGVVSTAAGVLSSPQYPIGAILAALMFLALQHQFDRKDPKLVLAARNQRDIERTFPDRFAPDRGDS
jgi:hypothetical protein